MLTCLDPTEDPVSCHDQQQSLAPIVDLAQHRPSHDPEASLAQLLGLESCLMTVMNHLLRRILPREVVLPVSLGWLSASCIRASSAMINSRKIHRF